MEMYMRYVNDLAIENVKVKGHPFGACIVYEGKIIAEGVNQTHLVMDVSAHAEMIAIRNAQKVLNSFDLSKCILFASGHPCPMCLGAIGFTNIKTVYYGNSLLEAKDVGLGLSLDIYQYIRNLDNDLGLELRQLKIEGSDPMLFFKDNA